MSDSIWTIPLFPMETVLFPYTALPLRIFEPHLREMVAYCLEHDAPFGAVLIRAGSEVGDRNAEPHEIGTLARIGRMRRQPDGLIHLLALGEERFQIVRLIRDEAPYLKAQVRLWRDFEPLDWGEQQRYADQVAQQFREFLMLALDLGGLRVEEVELPRSPTALSFVIAGTLQLEIPLRQYLLELQDTLERLRLLQQTLEYLTNALATEIQPFNPEHWREYVHRN
ncbi:MAG: ATP-dependent protease [Armatimonadetes bacterium JP3_11]|nr:MAG: ATP-dependent protease [Armatimonadetes bacterium JP3_11]RMH10333.1 MAG: ATP-dependent protease [Armatimonadota bacterium]